MAIRTTPAIERDKFQIPVVNWDRFAKEIGRISRKSEKLGHGTIDYMVYGRDVKEIDGNKVDVYEVHVPYDQPLIAGWELVAVLDHTSEGNIVRPTCEEILPDHYRNNSFCEHCGINRRRNTTYVLKKDGEFKQVGSTCLEDFTGDSCAANVAAYAELISSLREVCAHYRNINFKYTLFLSDFLATCIHVIAKHGWVSSKQAYDMGCLSSKSIALQTIGTKVDAADYDKANKVIDWARNLTDADTATDYMHNLFVAAKSDIISKEVFGIVASMPVAYDRYIGRKNQKTENIGDMTGILALFDKAKQSKLKFPAFVLPVGEDTIRLSLAGQTAKFPGSVNVTSEGSFETRSWYGRIVSDGNFHASAKSNSDIVDTLKRFADDPETVAAEMGKLTGRCVVCNKGLTDPRSAEVGYGKVCAKKLGWKWG